MSKIYIRRAVPADKASWLKMRTALWPECGEDQHVKEIDRWLAEPERYPAWVAQGEMGLCGFIEASLHERVPGCMASPVGYIEGWYVAPDCRGCGVGRELVRSGEEWALAQGALEIGSDTYVHDAGSRTAHGRLGYREVCIEGDTVCFIKALMPVDSVFGGPQPGVRYLTRYGAYAIIEDNGRIAAMRIPRGLFLPGGGMEGPEDFMSCLAREIREEMGYRIKPIPGGYIGRAAYYGHSLRIGGPLHTIACFYRAEIAEHTGQGTEPDHELVWLDPVEAARSLYLSHQRWAVAKACGLPTEDADGGEAL